MQNKDKRKISDDLQISNFFFSLKHNLTKTDFL